MGSLFNNGDEYKAIAQESVSKTKVDKNICITVGMNGNKKKHVKKE